MIDQLFSNRTARGLSILWASIHVGPPWQWRPFKCEASTVAVASVNSALLTLLGHNPVLCASSRIGF
jgi:hypothetical protein